jgi:hypothetical protein
MVAAMAQPIEFYVPEKFRRKGGQRLPPEQRGKVIPFPQRNRSLHDRKTLHLLYPSDQSGWQADTAICAPLRASAYLDW